MAEDLTNLQFGKLTVIKRGDNDKSGHVRWWCKCVVCGIEGKYFAKEKFADQSTYHLNLYAVDDNGDEILMTKDHIIPRSKGGIDDISNYQTMCKLCNEAKGNKLED